jgi:class 3 adenylate cyclase/tetratricopeptide (TPR) repeat protein
MAGCPSCGRENPDDARFCNACGAQLTRTDAREVRKTVTVLFADVVGSTALGEATDPEALRARMRSYFEDLRAVVERHGGVVEKFIGDAVMAVFGIPASHEDDALRAVRVAVEIRETVSRHGLEARIGVNTGEVVVGGEGETLITGDAVNVAARLEQAAASGEALIGAQTRALVRDAVRVEPIHPLTLKGKSEPVPAFRLLEVWSDAAPLARHLETPLVGRERERERLWRDYEDAVADSTCRLFTLLGPAGIGKSRLVADFLHRVGDSADVLRGRCLSYGEGITYWPLVEILVAVGVEPDSVIGTSPPETQLAFRRLLEARAAERPQVVVIDDLQWAEPVFVDLVEHVADLSRDAPIFLLCVARTELLDARPDWGGGKLNATSLLLEPLRADECAELMTHLVPDADLDSDLRERITKASAGNPLFVEEMLAMVRERGNGDVEVPPTIHALLQARIDSLDGDERVVMERGAVEGEVFHRGAVAVLAPDPVRPAVESHLATLVRKELIRSTTPTFPDDEGFRFRHLLIRDAAYESLPKLTRAELHERFADWLSTHDLVEGDEIVGYHLEQAHRYRSELDESDPRLGELGGRAAEHLTAAGNGAMDRGDWAAARTLLRRARALLPPGDDRRALLAPELSIALQETGEADEALAAAEEASRANNPIARARGMVALADLAVLGRVGDGVDPRAGREEARAVLEEAGDHLGLAQYWRTAGFDDWSQVRSTKAKESWDRAIAHAVAAGAHRIQAELENYVLSAVLFGPTPVSEAVDLAERFLEAARGSIMREASALRALGAFRGMQGAYDEGRLMIEQARTVYRDAGLAATAAGWSMNRAALERRAGDRQEQIRVLREGVDALERIGDRYFHPTVVLLLAEVLAEEPENEAEVEALCAVGRERTLEGDLVNFIFLDGLGALLLARQGQADEAMPLARRSIDTVDATDHFDVVSMARLMAAETLALCGEEEAASRLGERALAVRVAKEDVGGAAWVRAKLETIGILA